MLDRLRFPQIAMLTAAVYALLCTLLNHPEILHGRVGRELLMWGVVGSLLWLYWQGYRALQAETPAENNAKGNGHWLLLGAVSAALLCLFTPPFHSTDLFGYINRGWQQVAYHANPYVLTVDDMRGWETDRMFTDHWVNNPSPYGFLYLQIAKALTVLGNGALPQTVLVFKGFNILMLFGMAALAWDAIRRTVSVDAARRTFYLVAWNPLILLHAIANGHNDIIMGFFLALAAWVATVGAFWAVIPALVAAVLIKYAPVILLPPALWLLIRRRAWAALAIGVVLGTGVFLLSGSSYLPDYDHFAMDRISRNALVSHSSIHSVVFNLFQEVRNFFPALRQIEESVRALLQNILLGGYALFYGWLGWRAFKTPEYDAARFIRDAVLAMAVLVCLVSLKFYPWYAVMFLPLAFFLPEGNDLRRLCIVFSCFQMLAFTLLGQAHFLNFFLMTGGPILWLWREKRRAAVSQTPAASFEHPDPEGLAG